MHMHAWISRVTSVGQSNMVLIRSTIPISGGRISSSTTIVSTNRLLLFYLASHFFLAAWGYKHGGFVGFPGLRAGPTTILACVGISLLSVEQACANVEKEISDWDFERVVQDSEAQ